MPPTRSSMPTRMALHRTISFAETEKQLSNDLQRQTTATGEILVDFDGPEDPSNPQNWSKTYKWTNVVLLAAVTLIANLATVMCIPATREILAHFHEKDDIYATIIVSMWELGEAFGPLLTAPLSEIFGRMPVYNATNIIFIVFSLACALSPSLGSLIAFRFLSGIGDASIALNASIVGDLFPDNERGLAMSLMSFPALVGPVAGPVIGGFLTEATNWRWAFWLSVITGGTLEICFLAIFRETYKPVILRTKARKLRAATGKSHVSKYDFDTNHSSARVLIRNLVRPAQNTIQSPIVLLLAAYISVVYGFLYILLTTITLVFRDYYHFTQGESGAAYLGLSIGMVCGVILCASTLDRLYERQKRKYGKPAAESRLPPMLAGAIGIPIGLFLYGWTAQYHVFWIVPIIGTATMGFAFFVTTIPLQSYLVDAFGVYAASAIGATVICRCIVGAVMPLAGPRLYRDLGLGWGNSVLGFIAIAFMPVPLLFIKFGERIRARSSINIME